MFKLFQMVVSRLVTLSTVLFMLMAFSSAAPQEMMESFEDLDPTGDPPGPTGDPPIQGSDEHMPVSTD